MSGVRIQNVLHVELLSGLVSLINIRMPTGGGGNYNISLVSGNIFFSTANNFLKVSHNEPEAGTCFHANHIVQTTSNETLHSDNIIENATARKISKLCSDDACSGDSGEQISISVLRGALFASLSNVSLEKNSSTTAQHASTLNNSWLSLENSRSIAEMKTYRGESPNTDIYTLISLKKSSLGSPPDFIFTNAPIYLQLAPWVLSSISFGIVTPRVFKIPLQVVPQCGFTGAALHSTDDIGSKSSFLEKVFKDEPTDVVGARLVRPAEGGYIDSGLTAFSVQKKWFNRDITVVTATYTLESNNVYREDKVNSYNNGTLNSAMFVSVLLALFFGVSFAILSFAFISSTINEFFDKFDRFETFTKLKDLVEKPQYRGSSYKEKYTKQVQNNNDENKDEKIRNIFLYTLPEIFLTLFKESRTDSLKAFLSAFSKPSKTRPKKPKRFEAAFVLPMYEEFCTSYTLYFFVNPCSESLISFM